MWVSNFDWIQEVPSVYKTAAQLESSKCLLHECIACKTGF